MYGGQEILFIAVLGTLLGMVLGIAIGVVAAYGGGWWDEVIMRLNDVVLSFPQILLALVVLTAVEQPSVWILIVLVGVSHAPRVARLARGVALGIVSRDFVIAAEALGEKRSRVILAEVLPNMNAPLLAEAGLRLTYSIGAGRLASASWGSPTDPGAANWGQMIQENRLGARDPAVGGPRAGADHRDLRDRHQPDGRRHRPSSAAGRQLMTATTEPARSTGRHRGPGRRGPRRRPHRQGRRRRRRHRPGAQARRGRRPGRRVGLRQDDRRHVPAQLLAGRRASSRRARCCSRVATCSA